METSRKQKQIRMIMKIAVICLIYRAISTSRQGIFNVTYWDKYIYSIICCFILFIAIIYENKMKFYISKVNKKILYYFVVPMIFFVMYSMFINFIKPTGYSDFYFRIISNLAYLVLEIIQALLMYTYFRKDAIDIAFFAYMAGFFTSVIVAFATDGFTQFYSMLFDSTYNGSVLEMSELIPTFGLFFIYYLYLYKHKMILPKKGKINIVLSLTAMILGMKRIVILSLLIVIGLYVFLNKRKHIKKCINVITIIFILIIFSYVYLIRSEILFKYLDKFNINTMARTEFWLAIEEEYTFSPFYMGKGLGYTTKWLDNNWSNMEINGLTQTTGLHNDVLKYYIDLGFIGFFIYLYYYLKVVSNKILKNVNKESAVIYFLCMIFQVLCWFTDNVSFYHIFMWIFYLILFSLFENVKELKKQNE